MGGENCWALNQAKKLQLNWVTWPSTVDSIHYQKEAESVDTLVKIEKIFHSQSDLKIFTFCMRDLHNLLYIFSRLKNIKTSFAHGIYHQDDVYYLSSLSLRPKKIINFNKRLADKLFEKNAITFMNQHGLSNTLSSEILNIKNLEKKATFIPIPIPIDGEIHPKKYKGDGKIKIISISRFATFKVGAVLGIMRAIKNKKNIQLTIIGQGPWSSYLYLWIALNRAKNIKIISGVMPDGLGAYIDDCDIGYAQGTSILEIAKRGLPVIIAPYSKLSDVLNKNFETLGVFGEVRGEYAFGDVLDLKSHKTIDIYKCIEKIQDNHIKYAKLSSEYLMEFSSQKLFKEIINLVENSQFHGHDQFFEKISPPPLKVWIKKIIERLN